VKVNLKRCKKKKKERFFKEIAEFDNEVIHEKFLYCIPLR